MNAAPSAIAPRPAATPEPAAPTPGKPAAVTDPPRFSPPRLLGDGNEPLLLADWDQVLLVHFAVDPAQLAPSVPFPLDLRQDRAFVSLVAFTMRHARLRRGGRFGRWLGGAFANHRFLNVRTYVVVDGEPGIHFLAEHIDHRLSLRLGPLLYGLPYRLARIDYRHDWRSGRIDGRVADAHDGAAFGYRALVEDAPGGYHHAEPGSLTEWLVERYAAYTALGARKRLFRVAHEPWRVAPAAVRIGDDSLLRERWPWFAGAGLAGAHFSPGVKDVGMGRPRRL